MGLGEGPRLGKGLGVRVRVGLGLCLVKGWRLVVREIGRDLLVQVRRLRCGLEGKLGKGVVGEVGWCTLCRLCVWLVLPGASQSRQCLLATLPNG